MRYFISSLLLIGGLFLAEGYKENRTLSISHYHSTLTNQPTIKIAHLSDLQYPRLKIARTNLIHAIEQEKPAIILLTGDTIDRTETVNTTELKELLPLLTAIAPTYVVSGNHETSSGQYQEWRKLIQQSNAILLENDITSLLINDQQILIGGLEEKSLVFPNHELEKLTKNTPRIILSHHPENFEIISKNLPDSNSTPTFIFSGHAHGGQIRLPFIGGLLSPNQGWLPKLTNGVYESQTFPNTTLIVSRGLANSSFPLRINNPPHLIFYQLN